MHGCNLMHELDAKLKIVKAEVDELEEDEHKDEILRIIEKAPSFIFDANY